MGGLPCAKQIIDQGNAMQQSVACMNASILLWSDENQPTQAEADEFQAAANAVAALASKIERRVRTGVSGGDGKG